MSGDMQHFNTGQGASDVQIFTGNSQAAGNDWVAWHKPRGKTMLHIALFGKGGNGGLGVVGANSTAAGGGGGGSGGQTVLIIPLALLPDVLYLSLAGDSATNTLASYITVDVPYSGVTVVANNVLAIANGGANGGNASGATAGSAGNGGAIATASAMPIGWQFAMLSLAGQNGIAGGTTGAGGTLTLPATGLHVTGGTGGAGLGSTGNPGMAGGAFTFSGGAAFMPHPGGIGGGAATIPPQDGTGGGYGALVKMLYGYGGTGGGSTHGTASGAGLYASIGGHGAPGCGGGGNGGAFTGTTARSAGQVGRGGPAFAILTCW